MKKFILLIALVLATMPCLNSFAQNTPPISVHFAFFAGAGISSALDDEDSDSDSNKSWEEDSGVEVLNTNLLMGAGAYIFVGDFALGFRVEKEYRGFSSIDYDYKEETSLDTTYTSFSFGIGAGQQSEEGTFALLVGFQYSIPSEKTVTLNYSSGDSDVFESQDLYSIFLEVVAFSGMFFASVEGKINLNNPYKNTDPYYPTPDMIEGLVCFKIGIGF